MDLKNRIEPTLGERNSRAAPEQLEVHPGSAGIDFATKVAIFVIALAAAFWTADLLIDRYREYKAMQVLEQELAIFEATMDSIREEQDARVRAQRHQRASTTTGQWLAKNCSDWRASYEARATETAQTEMRNHCSAYQRYLSSGIVPSGAPR